MVNGHGLRRGTRVVLLAAAAALLVGASAANAVGTYTDPTGDAGAAPDIGAVSVRSDPAGTIVFRIGVTDAKVPGSSTFLVLDTDQNPETGSQSVGGAEYVFVTDGAASAYDFAQWNGSEWDNTIPYSTVHVVVGVSAITISVNRSELGNTSGFNFWVGSMTDDGSASDTAPDAGAWNYSLAAGGPDIQSVLVTSAPTAGPKAGRPFSLTPVGLKLPPTGDPASILVHPDSYTCRARLAGRVLAGRGQGGCSWKVPKDARGKQLSVTLTVVYQGASKSMPFAYRVR